MNRLLPLAFGLVLGFGLMGIAEAGILIDIQKLVNGEDADVAPGPSVAVGSTVTFTYQVRNFAGGSIDVVSVIDNNGTLTFFDDFAPTFDGGDTNGNGLLNVGETWTYSATRLALAGQYENIARVDGAIVIDQFRDPVFAIDFGHYFGTGTAQVPEPATLLLLSAGLAGLAYRCRRRRQQS